MRQRSAMGVRTPACARLVPSYLDAQLLQGPHTAKKCVQEAALSTPTLAAASATVGAAHG